MTALDWIILGIVLVLALFGWAQGFVTGALALIGFALGAWLGTRLAGLVLPDGSRNPWAPAIGLVGALCLGAAFAAGFEGLGFRVPSVRLIRGPVVSVAIEACHCGTTAAAAPIRTPRYRMIDCQIEQPPARQA